MVIDGKKKCAHCGEVKPVAHFYVVNRTDSDGLAGYCKPCTKAKAVEWQKANPEKKAATDKLMNQKPERRAKHNARSRRRRAAHPERTRAVTAAWQKANPEKVRAKAARHRAANPAAVKAAQAKHHATDGYKRIHADRERLRRAIVKERRYADGSIDRTIDGQFTVKEWAAVMRAFNDACAYCGTKERLTIEHLTPLSRGGKNEVGNVVPACSPCNTTKNAKTAEEFAPDRAAEIRERASLH